MTLVSYFLPVYRVTGRTIVGKLIYAVENVLRGTNVPLLQNIQNHPIILAFLGLIGISTLIIVVLLFNFFIRKNLDYLLLVLTSCAMLCSSIIIIMPTTLFKALGDPLAISSGLSVAWGGSIIAFLTNLIMIRSVK